VITTHDGCDNSNKLFYTKLAELSKDTKLEFVRLIDNFDACYSYITNDDNIFYFETNKNAPKNKVISIDFENPDERFVLIIIIFLVIGKLLFQNQKMY
jgi:prolyl oligopeptidase